MNKIEEIELLMNLEKKHREEFVNIRDKILKEGKINEHGFWDYDGAIYCVEYPYIVKTGYGREMGGFLFYSIELEKGSICRTDGMRLAEFFEIYKRPKWYEAEQKEVLEKEPLC